MRRLLIVLALLFVSVVLNAATTVYGPATLKMASTSSNLMVVTKAGGELTTTTALSVSGVSNAVVFASNAPPSTNYLGSPFAGTNASYDGSRLTNLVITAYTNSGVNSTNMAVMNDTMSVITARSSPGRRRGLNTWYSQTLGFDSMTNDFVLYVMGRMIQGRWVENGYNFLQLDAGWSSSNLLSGLVTYDTNHFPNGIAPLAATCSSNGIDLMLYCEPNDTILNSGRRGCTPTNLIPSIINMVNGWGVKGFKWDNGALGGSPIVNAPIMRYNLDLLNRAIQLCGKPVYIDSGFNSAFTNDMSCVRSVNAWRANTTGLACDGECVGLPYPYNRWKAALYRLDGAWDTIWLLGEGSHPGLDVIATTPSNGSIGDKRMLRADFFFANAIGAIIMPMGISVPGESTHTDMTNIFFNQRSLYIGDNAQHAKIIIQQGSWVPGQESGSFAIRTDWQNSFSQFALTFFNRSTNSGATFALNYTNIGNVYTNLPLYFESVDTNATSFWFTNSATINVDTNDGVQYRVTPLTGFPPVFDISSTVGTLPQSTLPSYVITNNNASPLTVNTGVRFNGGITNELGSTDAGIYLANGNRVARWQYANRWADNSNSCIANFGPGVVGNSFLTLSSGGTVPMRMQLHSRQVQVTAGSDSGTTPAPQTRDIFEVLDSGGNVRLGVGTNLYYMASSNGVVATNVVQPIGAWCSMMKYTTNTINGGANTYANITNYTTVRTNNFNPVPSTGYVTNLYSGYYRIDMNVSGVALDNGATIEGDIMLDDVERDEISFMKTFDPSTPRADSWGGSGILWIPANTGISFKLKSTGASGFSVYRAQFTVGTP